MNAVEILEKAKGQTFLDEEGASRQLELAPPLSDIKIAAIETEIGFSLPKEVRELLKYCGGFECPFGTIDFSGDMNVEIDLIPGGLPFAEDGFGNFWVMDLTASDPEGSAVFYLCHDPPVIAYQSASIGEFLSEVLSYTEADRVSQIDLVHDESAMKIWSENPGVMDWQKTKSGDPDLQAFAESLDDSYLFVDLRNPALGDGLSWGRYGAGTVSKRFGDKRIFAYQIKKLSWMQKLFGV